MFATNRVHILSDRLLTDTEVNKVRGIFAESNCANESLRGTFGDSYKGINIDGEYEFAFGTGAQYVNTIIEY